MDKQGRYLIIGDIHGNLPALEKLFLVEQSFDGVICHGDVVNYGPWSNECVELLSSLKNMSCLMGNHEQSFLNGNYEGSNPLVHLFFKQCFAQFTQQKTIAGYEDNINLGGFIIKHTIKNQYIFQNTELEEIDNNYIIGHSHQQFIRMISDFKLINTGSIGQNRSFINVSEYLILDTESGEVTLKSYIHDIDFVIDKMKSMSYPIDCINYYLSKKRA